MANGAPPAPPAQPTQTDDRASPGLRRIEQPDLGFALRVPVDWVEGPVDPFTSPDLVAQFRRPPVPADAPAGTETCLVYRRDFSAATRLAFRAGGLLRQDLPVKAAAELHRVWLTRHGCTNVRIRDAKVGGRPGARIDYVHTYPGRGFWSGRDYFVVAGDHGFSLSLGTWAPERDAALFDTLAAGFELIRPGLPAVEATRTPPEGRRATHRRLRIDGQTRRRFAGYQPRVRRVVLAAYEEAAKRGHSAVDPEHLLLGIAATAEGGPGAMMELGVSWEQVRVATESVLSTGSTGAGSPHADRVSDGADGPPRDRLRLTPRTLSLLTRAEEEAHAVNRPKAGVGELVIAVLRQRKGPAYEVLRRLGLRLDTYRAAVHRQYGSAPPQSM